MCAHLEHKYTLCRRHILLYSEEYWSGMYWCSSDGNTREEFQIGQGRIFPWKRFHSFLLWIDTNLRRRLYSDLYSPVKDTWYFPSLIGQCDQFKLHYVVKGNLKCRTEYRNFKRLFCSARGIFNFLMRNAAWTPCNPTQKFCNLHPQSKTKDCTILLLPSLVWKQY